MATVNSSLWREVSPYLDEALELDPSARESWLADMEKVQPEIARELRELLNLHVAVQRSGFLERSVLSSDDSLIGKTIGAYSVERLLGRGGMGSVWLGRRSDEKFEGKAAIKVLERRGLGQLAITQIRHEANLLARLSHAHIARLFDAGVRENGQPYLILEYIEGQPIDQYCQSHAPPLAKRLLLFLDVLDAERNLQQAEISLADSTATVSIDLVALYKALGGGWEAQPTATNDTHAVEYVEAPDSHGAP